jgi:hypothetical protein
VFEWFFFWYTMVNLIWVLYCFDLFILPTPHMGIIRDKWVLSAISGSLSQMHGASSLCGWRNGLQCGGYLPIYWISSRGQPTRVVLQLGSRARCWQLITVKSDFVAKQWHLPRTWNDIWYDLSKEKDTWDLVPGMLWACIWQVQFGTWSVMTPYRAGSIWDLECYDPV